MAIKSVQTLREFHSSILNDHLYILLPLLLRICSDVDLKLNIEVLQTIDTLKECQSFREHMGQIIH